MAKISFGEITLEDSNLNIDQLIEKYKTLFENDEFKYPLINTFEEEEDDLDVIPEEDEPEVSVNPSPSPELTQ